MKKKNQKLKSIKSTSKPNPKHISVDIPSISFGPGQTIRPKQTFSERFSQSILSGDIQKKNISMMEQNKFHQSSLIFLNQMRCKRNNLNSKIQHLLQKQRGKSSCINKSDVSPFSSDKPQEILKEDIKITPYQIESSYEKKVKNLLQSKDISQIELQSCIKYALDVHNYLRTKCGLQKSKLRGHSTTELLIILSECQFMIKYELEKENCPINV